MGKQERLAEWVSNIAAPPVLAVVSAVVLAQQSAANRAWLWAVIFGLVAIAIPSAYVGIEVLRGGISDIHVAERDQRLRPFAVALFCAAALWIAFILWPAPQEFRVLALAYGLQMLFFIIITTRWKISLHSAAAGSLTVIGVSLFSAGHAMLIALAVPVVAWARIRLDRHTPAQTILGAIVGALAMVLAIWLM